MIDFTVLLESYKYTNMKSFNEYRSEMLSETAGSNRYSIEVNYRTSSSETLESFAKICLGYVSAALKKLNYHVKHVYEERPIRILVSSRNWDDGEWIVCCSWNPKLNCFVISKGFWKKDTKSMSSTSNFRCKGHDASEIAKEIHNLMHELKDKKDRHQEKLKPAPLKRGPK